MNIKWVFYLLILLSVTIVCVAKWRQFCKGEKIIGAIIMLTLLSEATALFANYKWHNNMPVYHIYTPAHFFLISLYFNCSIVYFRKRNLGLIVGAAGVLLSILNTVFLQKITSINSYFLLFEATAVIIFCLLALNQILMDEEHLPYRFVHFWVTLCCLIYWSSTFTGWGLYELLQNDEIVILFFEKVLAAANFVFYLGIGLTLALYKRLIPTTCA